ncbi:MAG: hypothetical protein HQ464_08065 [Planctomycetes bacterium]|nr:hypothetical protein [Planctomycetota bacterium]
MTFTIPFRPELLCVICLVAFVPGCWNAAPPGRVTAYGEVKVNGEPVPDGSIGFEAVEDGIGGAATRIEAGGTFKVFLRPSTYRIGIVSVEGGLSPAGFGAVEKSKIRVPAKYALPSSSGIEVKVDAKNRQINLDLTP